MNRMDTSLTKAWVWAEGKLPVVCMGEFRPDKQGTGSRLRSDTGGRQWLVHLFVSKYVSVNSCFNLKKFKEKCFCEKHLRVQVWDGWAVLWGWSEETVLHSGISCCWWPDSQEFCVYNYSRVISFVIICVAMWYLCCGRQSWCVSQWTEM